MLSTDCAVVMSALYALFRIRKLYVLFREPYDERQRTVEGQPSASQTIDQGWYCDTLVCSTTQTALSESNIDRVVNLGTERTVGQRRKSMMQKTETRRLIQLMLLVLAPSLECLFCAALRATLRSQKRKKDSSDSEPESSIM